MRFQEKSYNIHEKMFSLEKNDATREKLALAWMDSNSADYWRHDRGFWIVNELDKNTSWLTVGDGRWGMDSVKLRNKGFHNVIPSDICDSLLKEAQARELIDQYKVINVEQMNQEEDSVDYIFCKESFHHFPRPIKAVYEMLRVASKGVILIEPNDADEKIVYTWEQVGNFVYTLSLKEIIKIALALDLPAVAYYGYNDCYIEGCEFEPADVEKSDIFKKMVTTIKKLDKEVEEGKRSFSLLSVAIFKIEPSQQEIEKMTKSGCKYLKLPRNPVVNQDFDHVEYACRDIDDKYSYYIYGTGNWSNKITEYMEKRKINILQYINSDSHTWGKEHHNKLIISPEMLKQEKFENSKVIIAISDYKEILDNLIHLGIDMSNIVIPNMDYLYLDKGSW